MAMGGQGAAQVEADESVVIDVQTPVDMPAKMPVAEPSANAQADALSALINLGYGHGDAAAAVAQASGETPDAGSSGLIRAALKLLAPSG